jgi:hypothetical protein
MLGHKCCNKVITMCRTSGFQNHHYYRSVLNHWPVLVTRIETVSPVFVEYSYFDTFYLTVSVSKTALSFVVRHSCKTSLVYYWARLCYF